MNTQRQTLSPSLIEAKLAALRTEYKAATVSRRSIIFRQALALNHARELLLSHAPRDTATAVPS